MHWKLSKVAPLKMYDFFSMDGHSSPRPGQRDLALAPGLQAELLVTCLNEQAAKLPQREAPAQAQF